MAFGVSDLLILIKARDQTGGALKSATRGLMKLKTIGIGAGIALAAAAGGVAISSVKMAAGFDKGMREVNTLLNLTENEFQKLRNDTLDLSKDIGIVTTQVVPSLYQAISAGVPRDNVMTFLSVAGKLSIGGVTDMTAAVDILTSATNAFGKEAGSTTDIADSLFTAVRLGKTTMGELSASFATAGPLAAAVGVSMDEMLAAVSSITLTGAPTSEAFTQVRASLLALQRVTPDMSKVLKAMGFATGEAALESLGLIGTLQALREQADLSGVSLIKMTGRAEGMQAILALSGDAMERTNQIFAEFRNKGGAAAAAFDEMEKSTFRLWDRVKTKLNVIMIRLGDIVLPLINQELTKFSDWVDNNEDGIISAFRNIANVIGDVATATGKFFGALDFITEGPAKFIRLFIQDLPGGFLEDEKKGTAGVRLAREQISAADLNLEVVIAEFGKLSDEAYFAGLRLTGLKLRLQDFRKAAEDAMIAEFGFAAFLGVDITAASTSVIDSLGEAASVLDEFADATDEMADRIQSAAESFREGRVAEIMETFMRDGAEGVDKLRTEFARLDSDWFSKILPGMRNLNEGVVEIYRSMWDRVGRETELGAETLERGIGGILGLLIARRLATGSLDVVQGGSPGISRSFSNDQRIIIDNQTINIGVGASFTAGEVQQGVADGMRTSLASQSVGD